MSAARSVDATCPPPAARAAPALDGPNPSGEPTWRAAGLRYYRLSHFLLKRFGGRIHRVSVDGGFTCPNVDGTVATSGCVYCDNRSFSPPRRGVRLPVLNQIDSGIDAISQRLAGDRDYLAYFQAGTNTYGPLEKLERLFRQALAHPRIRGLVIGTRPDCVPDSTLDLLEEMARSHFVSVEYGLESPHEASLRWMNRGHDAACFFDAVRRTRGRGIDISAHVILGLPGESREDMLATADLLAGCGLDGVKIHNLYVVKGTPLESQYRSGEVRVLERDEYLDLFIAFLERLPSHLVIHRVIGDAPRDYLVAPDWVRRKAEFLFQLDREMTRRATWQGRLARH